MTATRKYRSVEYKMIQRGTEGWVWTYYPEVGTGLKQSGMATGSRDDAELACKRAIDTFLVKNS